MKSHIQKTILLSFIFGSALAVPLTVQANQSGPTMRETAAADREKISGTVEALSDDNFTVKGQTVHVTSASSVTKGGTPIKLSDISVGDKVTVSTIKNSEGKLLAVTVDVAAGDKS